MSRSLQQVHDGPHLYGPGGRGWVALDMAQFLRDYANEAILEARDMPGFSEGGVTYQSHHFWVHLLGDRLCGAGSLKSRFSGVLVVVNHGAGWEVWKGDYLLAEAMARYGGDERGLFKLCLRRQFCHF